MRAGTAVAQESVSVLPGWLRSAAALSASHQTASRSWASFPISIVPSMPGAGAQVGKIVIAFGDLSLAVALGSRRGVTVGISDHRYLEFNQTAMRGTERFDVNCAGLGDNANPGAVVGLTATA
jgi:hypothetical protein